MKSRPLRFILAAVTAFHQCHTAFAEEISSASHDIAPNCSQTEETKTKAKKFKRTTKTSKIVSKCQNETNANYVIADITLKFRMNSLHLFYN